jgi:hypothetical protein
LNVAICQPQKVKLLFWVARAINLTKSIKKACKHLAYYDTEVRYQFIFSGGRRLKMDDL